MQVKASVAVDSMPNCIRIVMVRFIMHVEKQEEIFTTMNIYINGPWHDLEKRASLNNKRS